MLILEVVVVLVDELDVVGVGGFEEFQSKFFGYDVNSGLGPLGSRRYWQRIADRLRLK